MLNRRGLLAGIAAAAAAVPARAAGLDLTAMRGSLPATEMGLSPGAVDDQSKVFTRALEKAAREEMPLFLPPGTYTLSNITLPKRIRITGIPGATRLVYGGNGHLMTAEMAELVELEGLVIDGANRWIAEYAQGLIDFRSVDHLKIADCQIVGSASHGIALERARGRVERCTITGAAETAIYSVEARGLAIADNDVSDCASGGILVHRWQKSEDNTMVTGNRVSRIAARHGGTGQFGNGINAFRADNVVVSNNVVTDCAFSAIRANAAGNLQASGNTCLRSGETALYAEFGFEGAVINGNIVDGAANGISVVNFNEGGRMAVVNGNLVRNLATTGPYPADPPGFGVGITIEADTAATGNVVENAPLYGMKLGWGPYLRNVTATANVIRACPIGIAVSVVEGSGAAIVSDNVIDGATAGGVIGYRWSDAVTGDLTSSSDASFGHLTVARNHVS